jgi:DNA-directed RNA polymerase specialized sigma24 family protein
MSMEMFKSLKEADDYTEGIFKQYGQRLKHYIIDLMKEKNEQEAEDILQTVFEHVLTSVRSKRQPLQYPFAYLCKAAKHEHSRALGKQKNVSLSLDADEIADGRQLAYKEALDYQHEYRVKERLEQVTEQIQAIPRQAVKATMDLLSQGKSKEEISRLLHQSQKTTNNHISLARGYLQQEPSKLEGENR